MWIDMNIQAEKYDSVHGHVEDTYLRRSQELGGL